VKNLIDKNSPGLNILKKFFSKEYFSYTELFVSMINTGKILLSADFGFICNKQNENINFFYITENPFLKRNKIPVSVFNNYNIFLPQKETITTETRITSSDNLKSEISFENKLSYISTPVFLLDRVFAYILFFKSAGSFSDEDYIITENISKFLSTQIDKLSAFKIYDDVKEKIFHREHSSESQKNTSVYHYNKKENKFSLISNSVLSFFEVDPRIKDDDINFDQEIKKIIHPDDLEKFNKRIDALSTLKINQVNECRYRVKDSTDNWRFFYHRDMVYYCSESGEPVEFLGIIQEEKHNPEIQPDNNIRRFIKNNKTNQKNIDMDANTEDLFDLNIIKNLKDLGGDNDNTFLKEVFELYMDQTPGLINDIKNSFTEKNPLKLSQSAHALKGASLNLGAKKFADICKQIEIKGKENNLDGVDVLIREMEENILITTEGLKKFI
jgi:HPt (histidine-containing phosphotransfer) domain-containing protein